MNIAILVLAAGKSSRMQSMKQLEKINGATLLNISLEKAIQLQKHDVYCVLGANATQIEKSIVNKEVNCIYNENYSQGLSTSIVTGLNYFIKKTLNYEGIFILLADQPAIAIYYLESMIQLHQKNPKKIIASKYGNSYGVPALFPKIYFNDLLEIQKDKGAKEFMENNRTKIVTSDLKTDFTDIDTVEDLNMFKKRNLNHDE